MQKLIQNLFRAFRALLRTRILTDPTVTWYSTKQNVSHFTLFV